jgi:putative peptidoglycan lipid II flippase
MKSAKSFFALGGLVTINLTVQFFFQWVVIVSLGAGVLSDAFFGTMALPQFILTVLSGSLTMVLVPMISVYKGDVFRAEAWNYFQAIGLLFTILAIVLFFTAQWWVGWVLPGFKEGANLLAIQLSRIQLLAMVFSAMLSVLWAVHSAKENFYFIEITSILANSASLILLYFALRHYGVLGAAWLSVLRVFLQLLFLMKALGPYRKPVLASASFKQAWAKLRPLILGNFYFKTDSLADRYLTSGGSSGELTLLNLAQQLYTAGNAILTKVLVNTMMPAMARKHSLGDEEGFNQLFKKRLLLSIGVTVAILLALAVRGKWALTLMFSFKNFTESDVTRLWWLLLLLGGFWIASLTGSITSGTFYAKGNTRTPTRLSIVVFTCYIPFKFYCYTHFGIKGLALSVSIYYMINFLLQLYFLRRHILR